MLFGVVTVIFFLFNIMPADPAKMMLGNRDDQKQIDLINAKYYFDQPIYKQYFFYLNDLSPVSIHVETPEYQKYITILYKMLEKIESLFDSLDKKQLITLAILAIVCIVVLKTIKKLLHLLSFSFLVDNYLHGYMS